MHAAIIQRWNGVVKPQDIVYVLGDVVFGKQYLPLIGDLNGSKRLVLGNHDDEHKYDYHAYFERIYGVKEWKGCLLSHIPVHPSQFSRYTLNVHGHLHTKRLEDSRYFNVSVEQNNLTPIPASEILARCIEVNDDKTND